MKEIILPHGVGDTTVRFPSVLRYDQKLNANLLIGFLDANGDLQPYIPVGGSVNALPAGETSYTSGGLQAVGAGATVVWNLGVDMSDWEYLIFRIAISAAVASGEATLAILQGTHNTIVDIMSEGAAAPGSIQVANTDAIDGEYWAVIVFCPGLENVDIQITNGNAAARNFTPEYRRFRRVHG